MFSISTIHSFCWMVISDFNEDIRKWYRSKIPSELTELEEKERKGRAGAASDARKRQISRLTEKLEWLSEPQTFVYDPNGVNISQNSLSHAEVLHIFSDFVVEKPMMAEILVNKYPFIFIDESQDTDKRVINALFQMQSIHANEVTLGLFGDTMQRIFGGGEAELGKSLPKNWKTIDKELNHRSGQRIVGLGNAIRRQSDGRIQYAVENSDVGLVRFYLLPQGISNKDLIEKKIRCEMAELTGDPDWSTERSDETAILLLEHRMASRRLGFDDLVQALSVSKSIRDRIFEGKNSELNFFSKVVWPLARAIKARNSFEVMSILRTHNSPLLEEAVLSDNERDPLLPARRAENALREVLSDDNATLRDVLTIISRQKLLPVPSKLSSFVSQDEKTKDYREVEISSDAQGEALDNNEEGLGADDVAAWTDALGTLFTPVRAYQNYIDDNSTYRTHQGVKGNEFERVMVIMDDEEAGGFMFSYDQYFGAKQPSQATLEKIKLGEETGLDRTRRLFYVTSTRAKQSLAHVIYTSDKEAVRQSLIERGFADTSEVVLDIA